MSGPGVDRGRSDRLRAARAVLVDLVEEFARRNPSAVAMDALILVTVSFFTVMVTKAWDTISITIPFISITVAPVPYSWPLAIAAIPLAGLLYFGWRSSVAFLVSEVVVIAVTLVAVWFDILPL